MRMDPRGLRPTPAPPIPSAHLKGCIPLASAAVSLSRKAHPAQVTQRHELTEGIVVSAGYEEGGAAPGPPDLPSGLNSGNSHD